MSKPLILCVDDTLSALEGRKMLLEENGFRVQTATNGKEALQVFVSHPVDLVLLDYHMPQMNGDVVAKHMKNAKPDVPIALLSADEWVPQSKLEAVDAFVPKCEPITNFLETVDYLLSLRFLFQPLGGFGTDSAKVRHVQNSAMTSLDLTKWLEMVWEALAEEDTTKRDDMLGSANTFLKHSYGQEVDMHN